MGKYLTTTVGWLRILGFFEGLSLLVLLFIAMPMKYAYNEPSLVKSIGSLHGALFLLFVVATIYVAIDRNWKFGETTWKVLISCIVPFGTFYVDHTILKHIPMVK